VDRFGRWASIVFGAFVVLDLVVGLIAIGAGDQPVGARLLAVSGLILGGAGLTAAIIALTRQRPWANAVAVAGLVLIVVSGVVDLLANLSTRVTIPIAAIAAVVVLRQRPPGAWSWAALRAAAPAAIVAALVVSTFWSQVTAAALEVGASPFAVPANALTVTVEGDCSSSLSNGEIVATVRWAWRERDILPGSTDGLFVRWSLMPEGSDI
jgi:hypothetical protein